MVVYLIKNLNQTKEEPIEIRSKLQGSVIKYKENANFVKYKEKKFKLYILLYAF